MYTKQTTYEEVMTLEEARKIIKAEKTAKMENILELLKTGALFLLCVICTVLCPVFLDGDITGWFISVPACLYFISKAKEIIKR